jgi:hypothetical protein
MEKWEEGYYITAMAGSMSGSSLVVMSKGTPYTQQSYKVRAGWGRGGGGGGAAGGAGCCGSGRPGAVAARLRCAPSTSRPTSPQGCPASCHQPARTPPPKPNRPKVPDPFPFKWIHAPPHPHPGPALRPTPQIPPPPPGVRPLSVQVDPCTSPPSPWPRPPPNPPNTPPPGVGLLPLQVDQQEVEGGLLRHQHGHQPHALGGRDVAQRGLRGPGAGCGRGPGGGGGAGRGGRLELGGLRGEAPLWLQSPLTAKSPAPHHPHHPRPRPPTHPPASPPPRARAPQCIELDFQYPSEGIHRRWDAGFRITACAATPDQSAFALSVPRRRPMDETQETLRT